MKATPLEMLQLVVLLCLLPASLAIFPTQTLLLSIGCILLQLGLIISALRYVLLLLRRRRWSDPIIGLVMFGVYFVSCGLTNYIGLRLLHYAP